MRARSGLFQEINKEPLSSLRSRPVAMGSTQLVRQHCLTFARQGVSVPFPATLPRCSYTLERLFIQGSRSRNRTCQCLGFLCSSMMVLLDLEQHVRVFVPFSRCQDPFEAQQQALHHLSILINNSSSQLLSSLITQWS